MEPLLRYFPDLSATQIEQLEQLGPLYRDWNSKINVCLLYTSPSPRDRG